MILTLSALMSSCQKPVQTFSTSLVTKTEKFRKPLMENSHHFTLERYLPAYISGRDGKMATMRFTFRPENRKIKSCIFWWCDVHISRRKKVATPLHLISIARRTLATGLLSGQVFFFCFFKHHFFCLTPVIIGNMPSKNGFSDRSFDDAHFPEYNKVQCRRSIIMSSPVNRGHNFQLILFLRFLIFQPIDCSCRGNPKLFIFIFEVMSVCIKSSSRRYSTRPQKSASLQLNLLFLLCKSNGTQVVVSPAFEHIILWSRGNLRRL